MTPALIVPCVLFLLATLNLVFRFVIPSVATQ
jgi:hypothetical protein